MPYADFDDALAALRREHSRATHHCTAARWLDAQDRVEELARDDGEPGGTAGRPMLRVLQGGQWINVGAVVVRYFGGTKLGTGGLARAYAGAVSAALSGVRPIVWQRICTARFEVPIVEAHLLERAAAAHGVTVLDRHYTAGRVTLEVEGAEADVVRLRKALEA